VRRPLNTIIGFADLIRSEAFGPVGHERYLEYARDIGAAGGEITTLIDELDEFSKLEDGSYAPATGELDLTELLERCALRVRGEANRQRVLVRTAIPESLPRISADQTSLSQAVLNLLASAIDQTPQGGRVILSAHIENDGSVDVHIRDSGESTLDLSEHFVVFRDGVGRSGETLVPVRSSVGLSLTRSLLAVNACSLSVDPTAGVGSLFTLSIPSALVVAAAE
jgi:signal transduction histidine kinase